LRLQDRFPAKLARRDEAPRTTVFGWRYKFGPLPNIICAVCYKTLQIGLDTNLQ
jgi:hypothetical protein